MTKNRPEGLTPLPLLTRFRPQPSLATLQLFLPRFRPQPCMAAPFRFVSVGSRVWLPLTSSA
ncbi:MAG: hypothetical protein J6Y05_00750 [Bacteroidales bacterium]|nr:hypothetical protein [Bacteroidales bacterium]